MKGVALFAASFGVLLLASCAGQPQTVEQKSVPLMLHATSQLNPHADGASQSVDVLILHLASPHKFSAASLQSLYPELSKPAQALGADLVDAQLVRVGPGEERTMELVVDARVRYVGVVAAFEQFQTAKWRSLVMLRDDSSLDKVLFRNKTLRISVSNLEVVASLES